MSHNFRLVHLSTVSTISIACVHTGSCGHLVLMLSELCFILCGLYEFKLESSTRTHTLKGLCVYRLRLPGGHTDAGDFLLLLSLGMTGCWNFPWSLKMLPVLDTIFSFIPNTERLHDFNDCTDILSHVLIISQDYLLFTVLNSVCCSLKKREIHFQDLIEPQHQCFDMKYPETHQFTWL